MSTTAWQKVRSGLFSAGASLASATLEYDTPKIVHIKNKAVGVFNRLVQLIIIGYIVGYAIIYEKGYQKTEEVVSAVTTKVQGLGYTNGTGIYENAGNRVWDSSDYVIPPQSPNSVFIMTNMWITNNQQQGFCGDPKQSCDDDENCTNVTNPNTGRGILNGTCNEDGLCVARAWCPIEYENETITRAGPKLPQAVNFTILIKNTVQFPTLDPHFRRRNVHDTAAVNLSICKFDFDDNLFCPIFSLSRIIEMLERKTTFEELAINGSVLGLRIEWNCDLDRDYDDCKPRYSARRLDDRNARVSPGFNFRFANTWMAEDGTYRRQLIKAYGIRVNIVIIGVGGKFDFGALVLKIGSGIALLAIATVVSDVVILYLLREKNYYRKKKYLYVTGRASIFDRNLPFGDNIDRLLSPASNGNGNSQSEFEESEKYDTNYISPEPQK